MATLFTPSVLARRHVIPEWTRPRPATVIVQSAEEQDTVDSRWTMPHVIAMLRDQACVFVLTVLACGNLIDVYGDMAAWAFTVLIATACGGLPAICSTVLRCHNQERSSSPYIHWAIALVFILLCQFHIGPAIVFPDASGVPGFTVDSLAQRWSRLLASFKYLICATPPAGANAVSLPAVWTLALWCALLASHAALIRAGGLRALVALPILAAAAAAALLGTAGGWHPIALGTAIIVILLPWLCARCGYGEPRRWMAALLVLALGLCMGWGSCMLMPRQRLTLRDHYEPPLVMRDGTSPLSGLRSYVKEHRDSTVLTAYDLPAGTAVRMAVMTCFDGNVWNVSGCTDGSESVTYRVMGSGDGARDSGSADAGRLGTASRSQQASAVTFTIGEGLAGHRWLPIAGTPDSIRLLGSGERDNLFYSTETNAAIYPDGMTEGMTYTVEGLIQPMPSDADIAASTSATSVSSPAGTVPQEIGTLASSIAGGRTDDGAMAQALCEWLRSEGWFSHGLHGEHPSLAGHGSHRMLSMLRETGLVGDSEQFASLMALMAQELSLPARVVLGVVPKDRNGRISKERAKQVDGRLVTEFTGNDVEAWVEVAFDRYGWVPFFPTPDETKSPDDAQDPTPPSSQSPSSRSSPAHANPLREERQPHRNARQRADGAPSTGHAPPWLAMLRLARLLALWFTPLWLICGGAGLAILYNGVRLYRARRNPMPRSCVMGGWRTLTGLARHIGMTGIRPTRTRRMQASSMSRQCPAAANTIRVLAEQADKAAFADTPVTAAEALDYWRNVDRARALMLSALPRHRRWLAMATPPFLRPEKFNAWLRRATPGPPPRGVRRLT